MRRECKRKWCNYTGRWDSSNSKQLIKRTFAEALGGNKAEGMQVPYAFELGNELCGPKGLQAKFEPAGFAADYARLRKLLAELWEAEGGRGSPPHIAGPACELQPEWYRAFIRAFQPDVLTHHAYLLGSGRMDTLREKVLDPEYLNRALYLARNASEVAGPLKGKAMLWAGEAGGAYNSGQHYVTDTFLSNFWFLDELGTFAAAGHHAYCRQTLVGGHYGLLNSYHRPLPDFWAALLWRSLMGVKVLRVRSTLPTLRAYAHCAREAGGADSVQGRVAILLINLAKSLPVSVEPFAGRAKVEAEQSVYLVSSPSLDSIQVRLNGEVLQVDPRTGELPALKPQRRPAGTALIVPPLSYMFVTMDVEQFASRGVCGNVAREPIAPVGQLNERLRAAGATLATLQAASAAGGVLAEAGTAAASSATTGSAVGTGAAAASAADAEDGDAAGGFFPDDEAMAARVLDEVGLVVSRAVAGQVRAGPAGSDATGETRAGEAAIAAIPGGVPIRRLIARDASSLLVVGPVLVLAVLALLLQFARIRVSLRALLFARRARSFTRAHSK